MIGNLFTIIIDLILSTEYKVYLSSWYKVYDYYQLMLLKQK